MSSEKKNDELLWDVEDCTKRKREIKNKNETLYMYQ
jgi:hypothetical protein